MGSPAGAVAFLESLVNQWNEDSRDGQVFDTTALQGLKDITAEPGQVTCRLPVRDRVQNRYGTLHGGCIGWCENCTARHRTFCKYPRRLEVYNCKTQPLERRL